MKMMTSVLPFFIQLLVHIAGCTEYCHCDFTAVIHNGGPTVVCEDIGQQLPGEVPFDTADIIIKNSPLFQLTNTNWSKFINLQFLFLKSTETSSLSRSDFFGLDKLVYFAINGHNLKYIDNDTFSLMPQLNHLD